MIQAPLEVYRIDMKYIRNLHNIDDRVLSVSPQIGKDERPFLGVLVICNEHSLLGLMFGKDAEEMRSLLNKCSENGNYLELLELYNAEGAHSLQRLREKQLKNGGIV